MGSPLRAFVGDASGYSAPSTLRVGAKKSSHHGPVSGQEAQIWARSTPTLGREAEGS